jgi:hypothetical protein
LEEFTQTLREWELFFSTVTLASATLAGLLFVSLSIRQERMKGQGNNRVLRLARGSFGDFLYVLMLGLVFLVPHQAPIGLAVALFVLGASRGVGLVRQGVRSLRSTSGGAAPIREIALPALAALGFMIVGVEVLLGNMNAVYGLVIVIAALLTTASWNAWLILVAEDETEGP